MKIPTAPIVFPLYFCVEYDRVPHDTDTTASRLEGRERDWTDIALILTQHATNSRALPVARPITFSRNTLYSVAGLIPLIHYRRQWSMRRV